MSKLTEKPHDPWEAFDQDDEIVEPAPEPGDFWGVLDDDSDLVG